MDWITHLDALARYVSANAALAVVAGGLGAAISLLVSQWLSYSFGQLARAKEERRARNRKTLDVVLSTYHELMNDFRSTSELSEPSLFVGYAGRMLGDRAYFPFWTLNKEQLYIFDNVVKKESGLFPTELSAATAKFYQSSLLILALIVDTRSAEFAKLGVRRRIDYLGNVFEAYYEHVLNACEVLLAFDRWVDRQPPAVLGTERRFADLSWTRGRYGLVLPSYDFDHVTTRWLAYRRVRGKAARERHRFRVIKRAVDDQFRQEA